MVATKDKAYTMAQLRAHKGTLYIRNNTGFLWTLHEGQGAARVDLELRPARQPGSITYLPAAGLDAPGVARNFASGKVTVSPDLEDEMIALMGEGTSATQKVLDQYQVEVQESPNRRAIDAKEQMGDLLSRIDRKRITPQAEQGVNSTVEEFTNPAPITAADGRVFDPKTSEVVIDPREAAESTEVKSVTITRSRKAEEN